MESIVHYFLVIVPAQWEMTPFFFRLGVVALICGMTGSFINMAMWRVPRRESIFLPRSHCPVCKHVLGAGDLVPVLSYIFLRGKCRYCKTKFGMRYMLIELFLVLCGSLLYFYGGLSKLSLVVFFSLAFLIFLLGVGLRQVLDRQILDRQKGFTYIEVMMALVIVATIIIPFGNNFLSSYGRSIKNKEYFLAYNLLEEKLEELKIIPFSKIRSDYEIYVTPPDKNDGIFVDEHTGLYREMRDEREVFEQHFSDILTEKSQFPGRIMDKFKKAFKHYHNREYELYPPGYKIFKRYTVIEDVSDAPDKKYEPHLVQNKTNRKDLLKITVIVWIDSKTSSRKLKMSMYKSR